MNDLSHKGWICLDIDGTLTDQIQNLPKPVSEFLTKLYQQNWKIAFVTGRLFEMAWAPLKDLDFPYYLAVQNGASWYEMPQKLRKSKKYLPLSTFLDLEPLLKETFLDFVLVSGHEEGDLCYYRPDHLKAETSQYFKTKLSKEGGNWKAVSSFRDLEIQEFPYGKIYGLKEELQHLQVKFQDSSLVKTCIVQDSVNPKNFILQVLGKDTDKGKAVLDILDNAVLPRPIISAGNDLNDETLLTIADVKIAMAKSPQLLLDIADIVAPPVEEMGIIPALTQAIQIVESS